MKQPEQPGVWMTSPIRSRGYMVTVSPVAHYHYSFWYAVRSLIPHLPPMLGVQMSTPTSSTLPQFLHVQGSIYIDDLEQRRTWKSSCVVLRYLRQSKAYPSRLQCQLSGQAGSQLPVSLSLCGVFGMT